MHDPLVEREERGVGFLKRESGTQVLSHTQLHCHSHLPVISRPDLRATRGQSASPPPPPKRQHLFLQPSVGRGLRHQLSCVGKGTGSENGGGQGVAVRIRVGSEVTGFSGTSPAHTGDPDPLPSPALPSSALSCAATFPGTCTTTLAPAQAGSGVRGGGS